MKTMSRHLPVRQSLRQLGVVRAGAQLRAQAPGKADTQTHQVHHAASLGITKPNQIFEVLSTNAMFLESAR